MFRLRIVLLALCGILALAPVPTPATAAARGTVYADQLATGWFNWSWDTTVTYSANWPRLFGSHPLAFTYNAAWAGLNLHTSGVDTAGYDYLQFFLNHGSASVQPLQVLLYDANQQPIATPQPLASYVQNGSVAGGQWSFVRIPLSVLGGSNRLIGGILIQDNSNHSEPTMYLDGLTLGMSNGVPGVATTSTMMTATAADGLPPALPISGPKPFQVPGYGNEYIEAKTALQWLPQIKRAVDDAINAGILNENERQLWENILLGQVGIESAGQAFIVPNPSSPNYSQGLTQLTYPTLYKEENPFDPLTNLRTVLRTTVRYYRRWGNRWDRAVAQYLIGSEDENTARYSADWNGTTGQMYVERMVNVVWEANQLVQAGDLYPPHDDAVQAACGGSTCAFDHAPPWSIWESPALPYNWLPPRNDTAFNYVRDGVDGNISLPIATNTWDGIPSWFYTTSPAPNVAIYQPPVAGLTESVTYTVGNGINSGPWQETYPRRTWKPGQP